MYSAILRISTALLGVGLIALGVLFKVNGDGSTGSLIGALIAGLIGAYLIVAAIIPHRSVTDPVGEEVFWRVVWEIPLRLVGRVATKLIELF